MLLMLSLIHQILGIMSLKNVNNVTSQMIQQAQDDNLVNICSKTPEEEQTNKPDEDFVKDLQGLPLSCLIYQSFL